jgi:hypothetical protein
VIAADADITSATTAAAGTVPSRAAHLANEGVRLLREFPRPVQQAQLAGFLSLCRAHPLASSALDYAMRKEEQAERAEQRLEHEFWGRVRQLLIDRRADPDDATPAADQADGRLATALAQHLVAENLLRLALTEGVRRAPAARPGLAARPSPAARSGDERD